MCLNFRSSLCKKFRHKLLENSEIYIKLVALLDVILWDSGYGFFLYIVQDIYYTLSLRDTKNSLQNWRKVIINRNWTF